MNRLVVLKDVAYAAKKGGGTIAGANELNVLASGALAFLNDRGELLVVTPEGVDPVANPAFIASALVADSKSFTLAVGRSAGVQVINTIPRQEIEAVTYKGYKAPVAMVVTVGGITAGKALVFAENEEAVVKVYDTSFTSRYNIQDMNVSTMKRIGETNEAVVDRLVAKLNKEDSFVIAAKVGGGTANMGITLTPKDARTTITAAISGTFEFGNIETTTAQIYGDGVGEDILLIEKDFSVEEGNGNYIDYGGDYYKRSFDTDPNANYDVINMIWEGRHSSPTRTHNVMRNRVMIAAIDGAVNQAGTAVLFYLKSLIGKAFDSVAGAEPAADDGTATDGVAGN